MDFEMQVPSAGKKCLTYFRNLAAALSEDPFFFRNELFGCNPLDSDFVLKL